MNIERIKRKFIFDSFEDAFNIHRKISQEIREKRIYILYKIEICMA